jgi:hypothetical protein
MNDYSSYYEVEVVKEKNEKAYRLCCYSLPDKRGPYRVVELGDAASARRVLKMLEEKLMADN